MLDDNQDKGLMQRQLIGIVVVTVLVVAWSFFLLPAAPKPAPVPPPESGETASSLAETAPPENAAGDSEPAASMHSAPPEMTPPPAPAPEAQEGILAALPPVAEADDPASDEVILQSSEFELVFTRVGARLKRATVLMGENGGDSVQLIPNWKDTSDAEAVYPFGLRFSESFLGDELDRRRWNVQRDDPLGKLIFSIEIPGWARVQKTFQLSRETHLLDIRVDYTNLETVPRLLGMDQVEPAFSLNWGPNVNSEDANKGVRQEVVWRKGGQNYHFPTAKLKAPPRGQRYSERAMGSEWVAIKSAYFVIGMKPEFAEAEGWLWGSSKHFRVGVGSPRVELAPGQTEARDFKAYLGPNQGKMLAQAWPGLDSVWQFFTSVKIMDQFAKLLLAILNWFHAHVLANYGIAIIFLTILVRSLMFPLTLKSMKNMKRMQKLAPEIEKIKAECGEDQQELQKRTMELYRGRGLNPLGGCFPLLLQMPVFIALYRMLWSAFELRRAPFFLWILDLSEPDRLFMLPFTVPFPMMQGGISSLNLLPILMGVAMVLSQKLMPASGPAQTSQQKIMMNIMPVFFSLICYNMAAGLNLYILVSTLLGIGQNYLVHINDADLETKKPKRTLSRPRHFYTAAQARKREIAREIRREKLKARRATAKKRPENDES